MKLKEFKEKLFKNNPKLKKYYFREGHLCEMIIDIMDNERIAEGLTEKQYTKKYREDLEYIRDEINILLNNK